jgi:YihY family inner membrane protein
MGKKLQNSTREVKRFFRFVLRVLVSFRRNQGLLLSGAIAYYTLLSIVPLSILILIVLSHFTEQENLLQVLSPYVEMAMPGVAATLTEHVRVFIQYRHVIGIVGLLVMLFFSSIAFTVLENAMSVIFHHRVRAQRRHFLVSAIIPYIYISFIVLGILFVSFIAGSLEAYEDMRLIILGRDLSFQETSKILFYLLGLIGEGLLLTSLYLVMPVGLISIRHAFTGGVVATILWEITRRVVIWYYSSLSFVNIIYGSLASVVVFLLSVEAAALIILLGAQVIAELEPEQGKV